MSATPTTPAAPATIDDIRELDARAAALAVVARLLGPDPAVLLDRGVLDRLRDVVVGLDPALAEVLPVEPPDASADELARRWIRWFEHGRIAPYEGSNVLAGAGGVTPRLADVAGFYRAFGLRVHHERPDHVVAEFEFLATLLGREAAARRDGRDDATTRERAATCDRAARAFVRDHLGPWIGVWAARVVAEPELAPWAPAATLAVRLTELEAKRRNVVPLQTDAVVAARVDPPLVDHDAEPTCGGDDIGPPDC